LPSEFCSVDGLSSPFDVTVVDVFKLLVTHICYILQIQHELYEVVFFQSYLTEPYEFELHNVC